MGRIRRLLQIITIVMAGLFIRPLTSTTAWPATPAPQRSSDTGGGPRQQHPTRFATTRISSNYTDQSATADPAERCLNRLPYHRVRMTKLPTPDGSCQAG